MPRSGAKRPQNRSECACECLIHVAALLRTSTLFIPYIVLDYKVEVVVQ